jgi:xanthine dehydrogenase molybdenum-binding subunit
MPYVYRYRNARFKAWDVNTNLITAQPFRGVELPAYHFAVEQLLDMLAEKLGISPVEIRMKNTRRSGETLEPYGQVLSNYPIEECIKQTTDSFGWSEKWKGWHKPMGVGNKKRGVGIATGMGWGNWVPDTTSAMVKVEVDGSVTLIIGTQDIGTGSNTTLSQIVAEVLGVSLNDVNIISGDTSVTPTDGGAFASRTLVTGGRAAKKAAEDAKDKLLTEAAFALGVKKDEVDYYGKEFRLKSNPEDGIPLSEIISRSVTGSHSQELPEQAAPLRDKVKLGGALAHAVEVEVDMETGVVNILKYVAVHDVGRAINPLVVENQIYGGVVMGLGATFSEALKFDSNKQVYLNPDYTDYKILTIGDVPKIEPIVMESNEPTGPFGAKGLGEKPNVLPAAAVANAVYHATGVRVMELPITPERILELTKRTD